MSIINSIEQAKKMGASDDQILAEILKQNPSKASSVDKAKQMGANSTAIISEIVKQNTQAQPPARKENVADKIGGFLGEAVGRNIKTIKGVGNFMFGGSKKALTGLAGSGYESAQELLGKQSNRQFIDEQGVSKTKGSDIVGAGLEMFPVTKAGKAVYSAVGQVVKTPLTKMAEKLYQSALKPRDYTRGGKVVTKAEDAVKIGLEERVWLTKGGVERVADKIKNFEEKLGDAITEAGAKGGFIQTKKLQEYVDVAKDFFRNQVDVKDSQKAIKEIDELYKNFIAKFGKTGKIPIQVAQDIKVATGRKLSKYYNQLTLQGNAGNIEGQKQLVRGLKDQIVDIAPTTGEINKRLKNLYQFDQALSKASTRINNMNLLGLPSQISLGVGGAKQAALAGMLEVMNSPAIKSGAAISLDLLAKGAEKSAEKGAIPINILMSNLIRYISNQQD